MNPLLATWHFTAFGRNWSVNLFCTHVEFKLDTWSDWETKDLESFLHLFGTCPLTSGELLLSDVLPRIN